MLCSLYALLVSQLRLKSEPAKGRAGRVQVGPANAPSRPICMAHILRRSQPMHASDSSMQVDFMSYPCISATSSAWIDSCGSAESHLHQC